MIVIERFINFDGRELKKTFSNEGFKIRKIGTDETYNEAIDVLDNPFQYEETKEKAETLFIEDI